MMPNNKKNLLNPKLIKGFHKRDPNTMRRIAEAIEREHGNLRAAADWLRVSVEALRRWIKAEPSLAEAFRRARTQAIEDSPLLQPEEQALD
jgi:hypothetical protein